MHRPLMRFVLCLALATACRDSASQATAAGDVAAGTPATLAAEIARNATLRSADSAIAGGHPWRATVLLVPLVRDVRTRTPAATLLAARAAAAWEGWSEVERLLSREPWIDSSFAGEGRELLARAALGRGSDSLAVGHANAAVREAP